MSGMVQEELKKQVQKWPIVKLGDVVEIKGGGTPSKDKPEFWNGDIPWASVKDFKSTSLVQTTDYITALGVKRSATNVIPAGNVIVPTRMALGKVAINEVDMAINQDLKALLVKNDQYLSKIYLMRFLESKAAFIEEQGKGATVKGITLDVLRDIEIPLPPLAEQQRITAILDKADAIRRKRQQAIQLADDFLRAVFLDMFGDPVTNPKGWPVKPLGSLVINKDGKRIPIKASDRSDMPGKYPYYGASGVIDYVNDFIFEGPHLLIGEDGANLLARSTPIAFMADGQYWVNNHAHVLGEKDGLSLDYLAFSINMRSLEPFVSGSAQPKLNQENLNKIPVQVPPSALIEKFLAALKKHRIYMENVRVSEPESLFTALSQKAFRGEL